MGRLGEADRPVAAILAGGQGRRLGGADKVLQPVGGRTVLSRLIAVLKPQCHHIVLNANGAPSRFAGHHLPVVPDHREDREAGPLAGILAAMDHVVLHWPVRRLLTVSGDAPFLPQDLAARLMAVQVETGADIVTARSAGRSHHVIALWDPHLRFRLGEVLRRDGCRKVGAAQARFALAHADWPAAPADPFFNINTAEDLAEAQQRAEAGS